MFNIQHSHLLELEHGLAEVLLQHEPVRPDPSPGVSLHADTLILGRIVRVFYFSVFLYIAPTLLYLIPQ